MYAADQRVSCLLFLLFSDSSDIASHWRGPDRFGTTALNNMTDNKPGEVAGHVAKHKSKIVYMFLCIFHGMLWIFNDNMH